LPHRRFGDLPQLALFPIIEADIARDHDQWHRVTRDTL
jgi:hypothetical protein